MNTPLFIYPWTDMWVVPLVSFVNNVATNVRVQVFVCMFVFFFSFWSFQTVFQSSCAVVRGRQRCVSVPITPLTGRVFDESGLVCVKRWASAVSVCISLGTNGAEHFFMFIGHLCIILGELSIQIPHPLKKWVIYFLLLSCENSLYILDISPSLETKFFCKEFASISLNLLAFCFLDSIIRSTSF